MSGLGFRGLQVWQRAKRLAVDLYKLSAEGELARDFGLRDQIRRSAVSVCSNIAEGDERGTDKDSIRFFYIAKGSLAELATQIEIAGEIGLMDPQNVDRILEECRSLSHALGALIKSRSPIPPSPSPLAPRPQ